MIYLGILLILVEITESSNLNLKIIGSTQQPESLQQESNNQMHAQEPATHGKVYVYMQQNKFFFMIGFLAILLIGSGIAVGIVIAMQPGLQIDQQKTYKVGGHETILTQGAPQTSKEGIKYQVFGTQEAQVKDKSSGRLLKSVNHKKVNVHIVFPEQGIVVTHNTNSSVQVRIDPTILLPILMQYDSALQELINFYSSDSANTSMISQEINIYIRSILNQLFTAQLDGSATINFQDKKFIVLEERSGKLYIKNQHEEDNRRKLFQWGWDQKPINLFSQNPVHNIAKITKTELKSTANDLDEAIMKKDNLSQEASAAVEPEKEDLQELNKLEVENCIPTSSATMSCELKSWTASGSYDGSGGYSATGGYQGLIWQQWKLSSKCWIPGQQLGYISLLWKQWLWRFIQLQW